MIVVADTSPLNYLVLIDEVDLLTTLFGQVLIPTAVFQELHHSATPPKVRQWISDPPSWLGVRSIASTSNPALTRLDLGEREAIQLALELNASVCSDG
jgi:predicted nucleic acid-binding protein